MLADACSAVSTDVELMFLLSSGRLFSLFDVIAATESLAGTLEQLLKSLNMVALMSTNLELVQRLLRWGAKLAGMNTQSMELLCISGPRAVAGARCRGRL